MQRRDFLHYLSAGAALGMMAPFGNLLAATGPTMPGNTGANGRVVVIGGGMAGTTVAKYLRLWGGTGVQVTLVEPNPTYISNIFSNKVLTGERTLTQLSYKYGTLTSKYGVKLITKSVVAIDPTGQQVLLDDGNKLPYDRLVIAPGIDFDALTMSGTPEAQAKVVHAWKAGKDGAQTTSLQAQIYSMTKADTFILTIPKVPYRCPPGPYERACVVADYLKRTKGGGKVVVLDANVKIQAELENFTNAFKNTHKNITYVPSAEITSIDANTRTVNTSAGSFKGKVINAIPPHKAGKIISDNPLLASVGNRWAGVNVLSYESNTVPNIHIIGDAAATTQPKAGHVANAEAKVCADAIVHLLRGEAVNPSPMTNSACYTPITNTTASWLSVVYRYDPATGTMLPTGNGVTESSGINKDNHEEMLKWFSNLMSDTFA